MIRQELSAEQIMSPKGQRLQREQFDEALSCVTNTEWPHGSSCIIGHNLCVVLLRHGCTAPLAFSMTIFSLSPFTRVRIHEYERFLRSITEANFWLFCSLGPFRTKRTHLEKANGIEGWFLREVKRKKKGESNVFLSNTWLYTWHLFDKGIMWR